jgi:ribosomal protein S18 acetylase RimI-like enzyme
MITIRGAEKDDCPAIARTHTSAVMAIPPGHYNQEAIASWAIPRPLENCQQAVLNKEVYVAIEGEAMVGYGILNLQTQEIEALYTTPAAKGSGAGLKLLQTLEKRGREAGLEVLHLNASLNAAGFYRRAGYEGEAEAVYQLPTGIEIRCVPMKKHLKERPAEIL